jgi:predicted anti-sigma-YlaC factor YlaD
MSDQLRNKLGAYLDGELARRDQIEVETHLETCQACRDELEDLQQLRHLLRTAPQPDFTPALDYKAQLMLQLPRRDEALPPDTNSQLLPWMAPTLVLAGWIFIQVTLGLSTLLLLAYQAGFLDGAAAWVSSAPQQMLWFTTTQATIGSGLGAEGLAGLKILNDAGLFAQNLVTLLLWQVGVAVVYWSVLTLVWHNRVKVLWNSFTMG